MRRPTQLLDGRWMVFSPDYKRVTAPHWAIFLVLSLACLALGVATTRIFGEILVRPLLGLSLAAVLVLRKADAIKYLVTMTATSFAGYLMLFHTTVWQGAVYCSLTLLEVLLAAALTRRYCGALLDLSRPARLARYFGLAVLPASVARAFGETVGGAGSMAGISDNLITVIASQIASLGLVTPLVLMLCRPSATVPETRSEPREVIALFLLLFAMTFMVFGQNKLPLLFLAVLPLIWIASRLSLVQAIYAAMFVIMTACFATASGHGPISLVSLKPHVADGVLHTTFIYRLAALQLFVASTLATVLPLGTLMAEDARLKIRTRRRHQATLTALNQVRSADEAMRHVREHDVESGLLNRVGLHLAITAAQDADPALNVFVAATKIDRYGSFRAAIGTAQAARLMQAAAERVMALDCVVAVARTSPDTLKIAFAAADQEAALAYLAHLADRFREPVTLDGIAVDVRFTIGLADQGDVLAMIHHAEIAVDHARKEGRTIGCFDPALEAEAANGLTMLSDLHDGLGNGQVWMSYQPKLNLRTGYLEGAECLIRWDKPGQGLIGPEEFIPIAEETGFIDLLTDWIVAQVAAGQAELARRGLSTKIAINISAHSLADPKLLERLLGLINSNGGNPNQITLELTETGVMRRSVDSIRMLKRLQAAGFAISIDDYGTGQSSLRYLRRLPAAELKIDGGFITNLGWDKKDAMLVKSTIDLAHGLGLKVVAEGVEDEKALALLALFGCDSAQGFHIARPMNLDRLIATYSTNTRQVAQG